MEEQVASILLNMIQALQKDMKVISGRIERIDERTQLIHEQTKKTNGRVSRLEERVDKLEGAADASAGAASVRKTVWIKIWDIAKIVISAGVGAVVAMWRTGKP